MHGDGCVHCSLDFNFDIPDELLEAAHRRKVVIFAGAGISTEVSTVFPDTVLEMAKVKLQAGGEGEFPKVLQEYQDRFGRADLIKMVKRKFDYIDSFPGPRSHARAFHRELATMPYLRDIVTTNWDSYFEEECGATPFISGADIALFDMPGRKVLKIHGSIGNLASVVATEDDYARVLKDLASNVLGGLLRQWLSTRVVVFIGYSLRDWNFQRLYSALTADMGDFAPRAYLVSPFEEESAREAGFNLVELKTSGVHFLRTLKDQMVGRCFIGDVVYGYIDHFYEEFFRAEAVAKNVSHKDRPTVIFCWYYHDGMRDALFRITRRRTSGEYSDRDHVINLVETYQAMIERADSEGRFGDVAYMEGYVSVLFVLLAEGAENTEEFLSGVPLYFVFGSDPDSAMRSEQDFREALERSRRSAPRQRKLAREIAERIPEGMLVEHAPFLADVPGGEW